MKHITLSIFLITAGAALATVVSPAEGVAQPLSPKSRADAQHHLDSAHTYLKNGDAASARREIEAALELVPDSPVALFALSECLEDLDLLASAMAACTKAEEQASGAGYAVWQKRARACADALSSRVARVTVAVPATLRALPDLEVRLDGAALERERWSVPLPIDKGDHQIEAFAPGKLPKRVSITIEKDGDTDVVMLDALHEPTPEPPPKKKLETPPPNPAPSPAGGALRTAGIVAGAVGVAALGVGAGAGVAAIQKTAESKEHCQEQMCDPTGHDLRAQGLTVAKLSTGMFIGGGALLAGGAALFLLAPSERKEAPKVVVGPLGVRIQGTF